MWCKPMLDQLLNRARDQSVFSRKDSSTEDLIRGGISVPSRSLLPQRRRFPRPLPPGRPRVINHTS